MTPAHTTRNGRRRRYYVSQALLQYRKDEAGSLPRISASAIEAFVEDRLKTLFPSERPGRRGGDIGNSALRNLRSMVRRIEIGADTVILHLKQRHDPKRLRSYRGSGSVEPGESGVAVRIPVHLRAWGGEKVIEAPDAPQPQRPHIDDALIRAMGRAHQWRNRLLAGESLDEIAIQCKCTDRYVRRVLMLAFLAPDIVEAVPNGTQPRSMTVATLIARDLPLFWSAQRTLLGFSRTDARA